MTRDQMIDNDDDDDDDDDDELLKYVQPILSAPYSSSKADQRLCR